MKIKIGEKITSPKDEPIALIFEDADEVQEFADYIYTQSEFNRDMRVYVAGPDNMAQADLKAFVKDFIIENKDEKEIGSNSLG